MTKCIDVYREHLTEREKEIAKLLFYPFKEIGEKLFISPYTVISHVNAMYLLTNTHNRHQLLIKLLKMREIKLKEIEYEQ